jgi:glutathione peroxidase
MALAAVASSSTSLLAGQSPATPPGANVTSFYDFKMKTLEGKPADLGMYKGKVSLVVNVASKCGYTPQYTGLESLYRRYKARGFAVLGFPCDQFGHQEPGTEAEISQFCSLAYDVTFPMFAKIDVNGPNEHPLYAVLKSGARGVLGTTAIKWNFTKFLVGRDGTVLSRFGSRDTPEDIEQDAAFTTALG